VKFKKSGREEGGHGENRTKDALDLKVILAKA
jgi:hypothetical protein